MDRRIPPDPVALCTGCHDTGPVHQGHPVGAVLEAGLGAGLPLGDGRRVVCHTCHDPHDVVREPGGLRMAFTPLCRRCHEGH
jgi:predicted CXXCH cytochrome family protein